MGKRRITIMIDEGILNKLRIEQARLLKKSNKSVSLSQVINDYIEKKL